MFVLESKDSSDKYFLAKNGVYKVGRATGDIVIKQSSISRKHAEIKVHNDNISLVDCNSKYYTRYNGRVLLADEEVKLQPNGRITFGEVEFNITTIPRVVTCTTGLKDDKEIISIINQLGGVFKKEWDDTCTHLTTNEVLVTLKVLHAIMDQKIIVNTLYWNVYLKNIKNNWPPPDPVEYFPPLGETMVNAKYLEYNPERLKVFEGKTFLFWTKKKQLRMDKIIVKARGKSINIEGCGKNEKDLLNLMSQCVVIDPDDPTVEQTFSDVIKSYKSTGKRLIPLQEIVMAILQCSCEQNCNPNFDRAKEVFSKVTQKSHVVTEIVAGTESEQFGQDSCDNSAKVIPASFDQGIDFDIIDEPKKVCLASTSKKKKCTIEEETQIPEKRIKLETVEESTTQKKQNVSLFDQLDEDMTLRSAKRATTEIVNPFAVAASRAKSYFPPVKVEPNKDQSSNPFQLSKQPVVVKEEAEEENRIILESSNNTNNNKEKTFKRKRSNTKTSLIEKTSNKKIKPTTECLTENVLTINDHNISKGDWLNVKQNVKVKEEILDDEERKWCERFNNTVVIVRKNLFRTDIDDQESLVRTTDGNSQGVKNFKKFKKFPVPKSKFILKCYKAVVDGSNINVDYGSSGNEDDL